ncbi:MAG: glycogen synthase GlgA [Oscillospiraceae bacterium]|nr:glycogen synthase GlgA [Oscillospiraceae bacterium]
MNVLFVTSECYPFATSGGLGDVSAALPKALCKKGVDCRVVLPLYGDIKPQYRKNMTYLCNFQVPLAWRSQYCGVFSLQQAGVTYYFLDNEQYFKRTGLYGYFDDGERFAFFSRAVLEMLRHIDFAPDILHTNDWQTALTDVYINGFYRGDPKFYAVKTLITIHNIQYQGKYGREILNDVVGIDAKDAAVLEYGGCINFLKGALESADKINTVSPTYAKELLDPWFSHGLDGILREKQYKLCGILNGIDTEVYDPQTDPYIAANYSARYPQKKGQCKKALLAEFGMEDNGAPVIGLVSRLVAHKGIDLVKHVLEYILLAGMQVVALGSGDYMYENCFLDFHNKYPTQCGVKIGFVPELARRIYAGSDMFLMPSKSEPCGLAQMIALRYGAVPVVRRTGGLQDSITDCGDGAGNGFTFCSYNAHDMLDACLRAKAAYEDGPAWAALVRRALKCDFSWDRSADSYLGLYSEMRTLW